MKLISSFSLLLFLHYVSNTDAACSNQTLLQEFDAVVVQQIVAILKGVLTLSPECNNADPPNVLFWLYTRNNINNPIIITNTSDVSQIDPTKKTIVIIHGWQACPNSTGFPEMKNAYLARYDCNVLFVDWSEAAQTAYTTAFCYVPTVAKIAAELLCNFFQLKNAPLGTVHIVGHSLGGQMGGYIGKYVSSTCGQVLGRISGLDPAKPGYEGTSCSKRLCPSDALFVDAIHTNDAEFGISMAVAKMDFYPNGGAIQPGCLDIDIPNILSSSFLDVSCSHHRAIDLWNESINSDQFKARRCDLCPLVCVPPITGSSIIMGEDCPQNLPQNKYCLVTEDSPL